MKRNLFRFGTAFACLVALLSMAVPTWAQEAAAKTYDVAVYGTTPGGIALAVRVARAGRQVLLIGHQKRLGGMFSYGLGAVDSLYQGPRAPLFDEFRASIHDHYRRTYGPDSAQLKSSRPQHPNVRVESRVAERLFGDLVAREQGIEVRQGFYPVAAAREEATIQTVTFRAMQGSESFTVAARVFADCSYEGDLAAVAKVPYRVGREGRAEFGEEYAGRIFVKEVPWPPPGLDPDYIARYRRLKITHTDRWSEIVRPQSTGEPGGAVQAYSIRFLLSADPANMVPITRPAGYDRDAFFAQLKSRMYWRSGVPTGNIPNDKRFINQPEIIGLQKAYVEGTWAERRAVIDAHRAAILSLLYFYQNDPSLPVATREGWSKLGLPRDEFTDTGHLPDEIYVREARRIHGRAVFTEHSARLAPGAGRAPIVPDAIGIAEWYLDSHACTPERMAGSNLWEGEFYLHNQTWPGQIALGSILPRGADNLLVPVCLSATHVAFGTVRVEPVWMGVSEAAAHVALLALERKITPASVPADAVVRRLAERRFLLTFFNDIAAHREADWYPAVQYLGTKGFFGDYDARPAEPLSAPLAAVWLSAVAKLRAAAPYDATALSVECGRAEKETAPPISAREFRKRLEEIAGAPPTEIGDQDLPLTRAAACRMVFEALGSK